jgi:23S rRNA pseudouridine2605 synthase
LSAERLQKVLASAGIASRRDCEELITAGRVAINGRVTRMLGTRVDPEHDEITLDGRPIGQISPRTYIMLHKPAGVVSTADDPQGRPTVVELVDLPERLFPVGRLDYDSEGLLLLTDDGELTQRLTHPSYEIEKEYRALLDQPPTSDAIREWRTGVQFDGAPTAPAWVELLEHDENGVWVRVVLHEGRKRQIREVANLLGYNVLRLIRVREGSITLGDLPAGEWRRLTDAEVEALWNHVGGRDEEQGRSDGDTHNAAQERSFGEEAQSRRRPWQEHTGAPRVARRVVRSDRFDRPAQPSEGRDAADRPPRRDDRTFEDRPPRRDDRGFSDRQPRRDDRPANDRPPRRDDRDFNDRAPRRDDRPANDRPPRRDDRGFTDRAPRRDDRGFNDRPPRRDDRPANDRPPRRDDRAFSDRAPRRDDRPANDRPPRRDDRPANDRPPRRDDRGFSDRPPRRDDRPANDRAPRRDDRGFSDRPPRRDDRSPARGGRNGPFRQGSSVRRTDDRGPARGQYRERPRDERRDAPGDERRNDRPDRGNERPPAYDPREEKRGPGREWHERQHEQNLRKKTATTRRNRPFRPSERGGVQKRDNFSARPRTRKDEDKKDET